MCEFNKLLDLKLNGRINETSPAVEAVEGVGMYSSTGCYSLHWVIHIKVDGNSVIQRLEIRSGFLRKRTGNAKQTVFSFPLLSNSRCIII